MYDQVRRRKYRVVMSGYYGFDNAGDDAILESIQQAIHDTSAEVSVTALSNDPERTRRQYGLEAIPRFRVWRVFSALWKGDAPAVRGREPAPGHYLHPVPPVLPVHHPVRPVAGQAGDALRQRDRPPAAAQ